MAFAVSTVSSPIRNDGYEGSDGPYYSYTVQVFFTGQYTPAALLTYSHTSLPVLATTHAVDSRAVLTKRTPALEEDSPGIGDSTINGTATMTFDYSPKPATTWDANPLNRVTIRGTGGDQTEVKLVDKDGNALTNSAGALYTDLPDQYVRGSSFSVVVNLSSNPSATAATYSHSVNSTSWHGNAAGTAMIGLVEWEKVTSDGATYYPTTFPITIRRDGHRWKPVDNGFRILNDDADGLNNVLDDFNNQSQEPVLLDGSGGELPVGGTPVIFPAAGYKLLDELDWSGLSLPDPGAY